MILKNMHRTLVVACITLLGAMFGFATEALIAAKFGATETVALYRITIAIPAILCLTVGSAVCNALFAELLMSAKSDRNSNQPLRSFLRRESRKVIILIAVLGILTTPFQQPLLAPDLSEQDRINFYFYTISGWIFFSFVANTIVVRSEVTSTGVIWLNPSVSLQRHASFFTSLAILLTIFGNASFFLAVCTLVSGCFIWLCHRLTSSHLLHESYRLPRDESIKPEEQTRLRRLVLSIVIFQLAHATTAVLDRAVLSRIDLSLVANFDYAYTFATSVASIFLNAATIVILPLLIELPKKGTIAYRNRIVFLIIFAFFVLISSLILVIFGTDIISLLLQRGKFNATDTIITGRILLWFCIGLPFLVGNGLALLYCIANRLTYALPVSTGIRWASRIAALSVLPVAVQPMTYLGIAFVFTEVCVFVTFVVIFMRQRPANSPV